MIEYLRGRLLRNESGHIVVDVNGVGYGLDVPTYVMQLPEVGGEVELFVFLYVQEQILRLYGFLTEEERDVFEVFLGTSGIGPKTAIGILSTIEIGQFARAIVQNDLRTLTQIPGIGKKTAERLVVELREKVTAFASSERTSPLIPRHAAGNVQETIEALTALGCKPLVAERAAAKAAEILGSAADTAELIREALKHRH